jgi:hypothetical protein
MIFILNCWLLKYFQTTARVFVYEKISKIFPSHFNQVDDDSSLSSCPHLIELLQQRQGIFPNFFLFFFADKIPSNHTYYCQSPFSFPCRCFSWKLSWHSENNLRDSIIIVFVCVVLFDFYLITCSEQREKERETHKRDAKERSQVAPTTWFMKSHTCYVSCRPSHS